jgi:hypothetical protein
MAGMIVAGLALAGCAGKGEMRHLDLKAPQTAGKPAEAGSAKIVVVPLEDRRAEKGRIGVRTHIWGGETQFNVAGDRPGDIIAAALVDRLKSRGWQDRAWNARLGAAGTTADADIVITGAVQEFSAHAKSRVFSTAINTTGKFVFQAKNLGDGSTTTRLVEGAHKDLAFWFDEEDLQELLTETMMDGIERFISDTKIEQKALRPVQ